MHPPPPKTIVKSMLSTYGNCILFGGVVGATLGFMTGLGGQDVETCITDAINNTTLGFLIGGGSTAINWRVMCVSIMVGFVLA